MKTLSFCKLESDVLAKFTIRLKSQSEQYKAITLRNVIDGSILMACTSTFLLSKYQFFTLAWITASDYLYSNRETDLPGLLTCLNPSIWELL